MKLRTMAIDMLFRLMEKMLSVGVPSSSNRSDSSSQPLPPPRPPSTVEPATQETPIGAKQEWVLTRRQWNQIVDWLDNVDGHLETLEQRLDILSLNLLQQGLKGNWMLPTVHRWEGSD
jgi:hypothetical protein